MPLRKGESPAAFKARVMEPVSPTFCGAKWMNSTLWLNSGQTASCHHPPMHPMDVAAVAADPSAIHNTAHKRAMRTLMLDGERPGECEYCWRTEDMGGLVSDRTWKTIDFSEDKLAAIASERALDAVPESLEVAFDRTCQFGCSYCSATFSSTWVRDIRQNGPYRDILNDDRRHHETDAPWAEIAAPEDNVFIAAFWRWWPELSQTLKEIRITGGEPLMSVDVWRLFDWFAENPSSTMRFSINSNLGAKKALIDRLIERAQSVRHLTIYTSNEAYGRQAEYIRHGLDYAVWADNIERLLTETSANLGLMTTINATCLSSITQMMDHMLDVKARHGAHRMVVSANILRHPNYMAMAVLPTEIVTGYGREIARWLDANRSNPLLTAFEIEHFTRLVQHVERTAANPPAPSLRAKLEHDFKAFHTQYDARRGLDFRATFPDLADWFDEIK